MGAVLVAPHPRERWRTAHQTQRGMGTMLKAPGGRVKGKMSPPGQFR